MSTAIMDAKGSGVLESKRNALLRDWNCINEVSAVKGLLQKLFLHEKTDRILIEYSRCISNKPLLNPF